MARYDYNDFYLMCYVHYGINLKTIKCMSLESIACMRFKISRKMWKIAESPCVKFLQNI